MKYYLVIKRNNNGIDILDTFLGCFSVLPKVTYNLSDNEEMKIVEIEEENVKEYVYVKCQFCNSMGFNTIMFKKTYSDLLQAVAECVSGKKAGNDTIFRVKIDCEFKSQRAIITNGKVTEWHDYPIQDCSEWKSDVSCEKIQYIYK